MSKNFGYSIIRVTWKQKLNIDLFHILKSIHYTYILYLSHSMRKPFTVSIKNKIVQYNWVCDQRLLFLLYR